MNCSKVTGNKLDRKSKPGKGTGPRSISRRLAAGLIAITVLISIVTIAVIYFNAIREQEAALMKRADEYRDYLVGALELPLWDYDDNTINTIGKTFLQNELAVSLVIKETSGGVIFSGKASRDSDVIKRTGKIYYHGELLGEVQICFTKRYVKEAGHRLLTSSAMTMLIVSMSLVFLTHLLLRIFLKKPLETLGKIVQPYVSGIYDSPVPELPYAEFQGFGSTLSSMGETIRLQMQKITAAEKKYRSIFENAREGIFQITPEGRYLSVNPAFAKIHGYDSPEELIAGVTDIGHQHFVNPENRASFLKAVEATGFVEAVEAEEYRRDGSSIWVSINAHAVRDQDGKVLYFEGSMEDITERKQAEEELRRLTLLQRTILDNAAYGIISASPDGIVSSFNPAAERLMGYTADEVVGKLTPECWHDPEEIARRALRLSEELGETIPPGFEVFVARARSGPPDENEWTFIRKDGTRVPGLLSVTALREENGMLTGFVGLVNDLSERKRAEEARRESEAQYRRIVDTASEGIWVIGPDITTTSVNARMAEMLGYPSEEIIGRPFSDFIFEEDMPDHLIKIENRRQGMSENYERRFRRKDGESVWTQASATPILDDEHRFKGSFAMFTDITERKRAEKRLSEQLYFLQQLLDSVPIPVYYKDVSELYIGCNLAFETLIGIPRSDLVGKTVYEIAPQERADMHHEADLALLRQTGIQKYEVSGIYNDGKSHDLIFNKATFVDEDNRVAGIVGAIIDITDRKQAEEEVRKLNEELEQRVKERTAELEEKNADLYKMNKLFVGRELRMIELKEKIRELEEHIRQPDERSGG